LNWLETSRILVNVSLAVTLARLFLLSGILAFGQQTAPPQKPVEPPEEDESSKPREYGFNPLQAASDVKVGLYYFKKGSFKAAAKRFDEATKWNPSLAEAFLYLGETREKMKDKAGAKEAYAKYLDLAPDAKNAAAIKKKVGAH
jgi:tetratricopeptide (TPR) repeat protein